MNDEDKTITRDKLYHASRAFHPESFITLAEVADFLLDLDERIERLRNPLTPESKEGRATLTLQVSPSEEMARRHGLKDKSQGE